MCEATKTNINDERADAAEKTMESSIVCIITETPLALAMMKMNPNLTFAQALSLIAP